MTQPKEIQTTVYNPGRPLKTFLKIGCALSVE